MTTPAKPQPTEAEKARAKRNLTLALLLIGFVVLIFVVTLVRLKAGVLDRPL
jgi:hypothetical protein